jgi:hypothetical protein
MIDLNDSINFIDNFLESSEIIGILVGQTGTDQLHCGIVYRFDNKFNAIHLAWHYLLKHEEDVTKFNKFLWIKSSVHQSRQNSISAMCRRILKRQDEHKIPYGLLYSGGSFSPEGVISLEETKESGLTCATFVLAVFKSCEIRLIDIDNWITRDSDSKWHLSIIETLKETKEKYNISDIHIENVTNEIGCARFRPEEVAISSAFQNHPEDSNKIIEQGLKLREVLIQC